MDEGGCGGVAPGPVSVTTTPRAGYRCHPERSEGSPASPPRALVIPSAARDLRFPTALAAPRPLARPLRPALPAVERFEIDHPHNEASGLIHLSSRAIASTMQRAAGSPPERMKSPRETSSSTRC